MGFGFLKKSRAAGKPAEPASPVAETNAVTPDDVLRVYCMGPSQEMRYAVELLAGKGLAFEEIDASADPGLQSWVKQKTGSNEYPQIFFGTRPLGDFGALRKLDYQGNLDRILAGQPPLEHQDEEAPAGRGDFEPVRARLRRGDVLSLTTPDGETFDTWAEIYANPPRIYYRGEPRPIEALDEIVGEIVALLADERTDAAWSAGS